MAKNSDEEDYIIASNHKVHFKVKTICDATDDLWNKGMDINLVADTNLYFECKALEQLPWHELGFDPIVILLTKPVLDEIDKHKKANGRTRKRALEIFRRIRGMLATSATDLVIQQNSPKVILRRAVNIIPDGSLSGTLDYTRNDDRLIGIVATLNKAQTTKAMLFTDDTGPAATADSLGVPFRMIPEEWRRPAQETTEEKKLRELEKDLATYRSQEPKISIRHCIPADETNSVTVTRTIAQPLTDAEIEEMITALRRKHPIVQDFNFALTPPSDQVGHNPEIIITYEPPSDEDITNYRETLYPAWLKKCRQILGELHIGRDREEESISLQWEMANEGTRPASQVRVQFEAQGPIELARLPEEEEEEEETDRTLSSTASPEPTLPSPPPPPAPKRVVTRVTTTTKPNSSPLDLATLGSEPFLKEFDRLNVAAKAAGAISHADHLLRAAGLPGHMESVSRILDQRMLDVHRVDSILRSTIGHVSQPQIDFQIPRPFVPPSHDPEAFYYDHWPSRNSVKKGALTCDLWRHQDSGQIFSLRVVFTNDDEARGSVRCTVHAENLTQPETLRTSIIRKIESFRLTELARSMVEKCT